MNTVTSADGNPIAYDRTGSGDPLVLAGDADSYRRYPGQVELAGRRTVYSYDRRGRSDSGDTGPYAIRREIDDLAAVIAATGGRAHVWGYRSRAAWRQMRTPLRCVHPSRASAARDGDVTPVLTPPRVHRSARHDL